MKYGNRNSAVPGSFMSLESATIQRFHIAAKYTVRRPQGLMPGFLFLEGADWSLGFILPTHIPSWLKKSQGQIYRKKTQRRSSFSLQKLLKTVTVSAGIVYIKAKGLLSGSLVLKKFSHLLTKFYLFHKMYDKGCISCSGNMSGEAVDTPFCGAESRRSSSAVSQGKEREKEIYGK